MHSLLQVVFNNLLGGCINDCKLELAKESVKRLDAVIWAVSSRLWDFEDLYKEMIASHVKPSVATFSILIRLYAQCVSISMVYLAHRETTLPRDRRCSSIRYLKRRSLAVDSVDRLRQALGWCIGLAPPGTDKIFWFQLPRCIVHRGWPLMSGTSFSKGDPGTTALWPTGPMLFAWSARTSRHWGNENETSGFGW